MKKIVLSLSMLFFILNTFGQTATTIFSKEYYLEKSQKQKKTGWRLLAGGLGIASIGGLVQLQNDNQTSDSFNFDFTGAYIAIGGGVLCVASIPYFIRASKSKKLAVAISIDNQNILLPQDTNLTFKKQASLCLRIEL